MSHSQKSEEVWKPTAEEIAAARGGTIPDVICEDLQLLFCGINPSLYSAAVGHHFARPGNRFWPALHAAQITDCRLSPFKDARLIEYGCGLTNVVARATARADELSTEEIEQGGQQLLTKVHRYRPKSVVFLGVTVYRSAFKLPRAQIGLQEKQIGGASVWILPNPSGLNAYQLPDFARLFTELWHKN